MTRWGEKRPRKPTSMSLEEVPRSTTRRASAEKGLLGNEANETDQE